MTRTTSLSGQYRPPLVPLALLALGLVSLAGCGHLPALMGDAKTQSRAQADDDDRERYGLRTVGEVTTVGNAEPMPLGGVGLVTGLEGTGGETPPDSYRAMLEESLRKEGVRNVKELLSSPNNAVVLVEAVLPPGARKGDKLDLEVKLAPGARGTSLRGGTLYRCKLFNYDFTRNLNPSYQGPQSMLKGHALAVAEGPVLVGVGLGDGDDATRLKQGRIWGGGIANVDQPFGLIMNEDNKYAAASGLVAERINETFQAGLRGSADTKLAEFRGNQAVALKVPPQYHLNQPRYLRVVRLIPLPRNADTPGGEDHDRRSYRQKLGADLLDPGHTVTAALRLEALGPKSIPHLKKGLDSKHPLVRFCSAEALAYLGSPSCGEELGKSVLEQPLFRAYGLAALASLDEAVCQIKLQELLISAPDDETRYGAFRALHALNERNDMVKGEHLNESFWLHKVPGVAKPLVHISSTRRAEVVLFGDAIYLKGPFNFLAGEFTVTATEDDHDRCTVSRFPLRSAPLRKQCSMKLEEVLRTMSDLGGQYPEVVALVQQANTCSSLTGRVRCDALPQAASIYDLVRLGKGEDASDLLPSGQELGATPTLYSLGLPAHTALEREQEAAVQAKKKKE